ncbi:MAG: TerB family tellurite resistance protein [Ideonella sp.]|nr:TerB family tellurite resistance protein [Ideonella sp.]
MRSYPRNSPAAAARIVALVLIADGHVCRSEFEALDQLDAARELGLSTEGVPHAVQHLCEDLLMVAYSGGSLMAQLDKPTLASIMAEVDDPCCKAEVLPLGATRGRPLPGPALGRGRSLGVGGDARALASQPSRVGAAALCADALGGLERKVSARSCTLHLSVPVRGR